MLLPTRHRKVHTSWMIAKTRATIERSYQLPRVSGSGLVMSAECFGYFFFGCPKNSHDFLLFISLSLLHQNFNKVGCETRICFSSRCVLTPSSHRKEFLWEFPAFILYQLRVFLQLHDASFLITLRSWCQYFFYTLQQVSNSSSLSNNSTNC